MRSQSGRCALIGLIVLPLLLVAQTTTTTPTYLQAVSTGIVSLSLAQTAQLNIVNLNPVAGTTGNTATACPVQLQFFDGNNNLLKQVAIANVSPGSSASLTLSRTDAANLTTPRFGIRGVVRTNPVTVTPGTGTPGATSVPVAFLGCPVKTTLEIFNNDTGNTQLVVSDVQSISLGVIPLLFSRP